MKKILGLCIFFTFLFIKTIAQNNLPPVYEITTDTILSVKLDDSYWQMLEDPKGKRTIDEISRPPLADQFHTNTTKSKGLDYSVRTFWLRYRFINSMQHATRITIPEDVTNADLYTLTSNGKWDHKTTGATVPWSKRDGFKRITTVIYTIQPGEQLLIYERDSFDYLINSPDFLYITFGFADNVAQDGYNKNDPSILPSFLFGLFLLAALFNLYFFVIVGERVYLFFSLTLFFRGFSRFLYANDIFFHEHPLVKWNIANVCAMFFFFFLLHFLRYFLETYKYFPRWDKYLTGLSIYNAIVFVLTLVNVIPVQFQDILGPSVVCFSILITLVLSLRSPRKAAWSAIVAALPVIFIMSISSPALFRYLNQYTGLPIPAFVEWITNRLTVLEQIGLIWLLVFFSWSLFERYQQLQKKITQETLAKERLVKEKEIERIQLIELQKVELEKTVDERTAELKNSLNELRSTQAQLIQSEKMASLGELTAGIAHEIQNPLNFVNNFSEVNDELISELVDEVDKGNTEEVKTIAEDIRQNLEKINHHGKRADAIVKGMLQHSRQTSGTKESTDINALCDEYLRLSYHGMRAKDKSFNADFKTDFDENIGKINIVPQDIGRVLLNLYNNAFYAVSAKASATTNNNYKPTVSIQTKKVNNNIEIKVTDNGNGILQNIIDKIFQPFFTTKPTGEGTGLGLSLSYDIIKAHAGEIKVETKEKEGSAFIIKLPI